MMAKAVSVFQVAGWVVEVDMDEPGDNLARLDFWCLCWLRIGGVGSSPLCPAAILSTNEMWIASGRLDRLHKSFVPQECIAMAEKRRPFGPPLFLDADLERQTQRHLDLAGAADGFVDDAETAEGWRNERRDAVEREVVEGDVLRDVVDGDIEAGRVGDVENVKGEFKAHALGELSLLNEGDI